PLQSFAHSINIHFKVGFFLSQILSRKYFTYYIHKVEIFESENSDKKPNPKIIPNNYLVILPFYRWL
ncbi:hypothetical protein P9H08_30220, partial [Bacillus cereus]|nr:hypothetical protein [Bacillus cereus]